MSGSLATAVREFATINPSDRPWQLPVAVFFALGTMGAVVIGFLYSVHIARHRPRLPVSPPPENMLDTVVIDSLLIGLFVAISLLAADLLALDKSYWVPVSCLAVIQGVNLRAVWNRQLQRIAGTALGLCFAWALVRYAFDPWSLAIAITLLLFCVETSIVRHYGFAMLFVTPLTILLAETATLASADSTALMTARLADTILGSLIGLAGGFCLHNQRLRERLRKLLQQ